MKRAIIALLLLFLVYMMPCFGCTPNPHAPENPYMEDRTKGWTAVVPTKFIIYLKYIDYPWCKDTYLYILKSANAQPSFCAEAEIATKDQAIDTMIQLVNEVYGKSMKRKDFHAFQGKNRQSWIISSDSYLAVFNNCGELLAFVEFELCDSLRATSKESDQLEYRIDLAQIPLDSFELYNNGLLGDTSAVREFLGDQFIAETPTAEMAYRNALNISQRYMLRESYGDEFRVYINHVNDAWLVLSTGWIAIFSQETGELVYFVDFRLHLVSDESYES